jgi:anti-sigma regulatory factor (Ser/Thr protein kinase)
MSAPLPDIARPLHERPLGGMGIYLARSVVDRMTYRISADGRNEITLTKRHIIHISQEELHESQC